jgi:hypothetical protein
MGLFSDSNTQRGSAPVRCCFCGAEVFDEEPGLLTLIVVSVPRLGRVQPRAQQLWCHARCLRERMDVSADLDADDLEA